MSYTLSDKDSGDTDLFEWDFAGKIGDSTDVINSQSITVDSGSVTAGVPSVSGQIVQCMLSAGTVGEVQDVRCRITTTAGRTLDLTASFMISEQ